MYLFSWPALIARKRMTTGCGAQAQTAGVAFARFLWGLRSRRMFWGPSPLVLFCELRQHVNTSYAARQAARENWQLLRVALEADMTLQLIYAPCRCCLAFGVICRGQSVPMKILVYCTMLSRSNAEKLWEMETCPLFRVRGSYRVSGSLAIISFGFPKSCQ